jgi:hypothetical protein
VETLKNGFSLKGIGENVLNTSTLGLYGGMKEAVDATRTVQNEGTYGLGKVVGGKLAEGTLVAAGEIGGKVVSAIKGAGSTTLFRAASSTEVADMATNGVRNVSTGYETGKLFATSSSDAAQFGKNNFTLDGIPNTVVQVQVPNSVMKAATTFEADGMKAVSIPAEHLPSVKPLGPLNYSPKPTNPFGLPGW